MIAKNSVRQTSLVFANANLTLAWSSLWRTNIEHFYAGKLIVPWFFRKLLKIEQFGCLDIWMVQA